MDERRRDATESDRREWTRMANGNDTDLWNTLVGGIAGRTATIDVSTPEESNGDEEPDTYVDDDEDKHSRFVIHAITRTGNCYEKDTG